MELDKNNWNSKIINTVPKDIFIEIETDEIDIFLSELSNIKDDEYLKSFKLDVFEINKESLFNSRKRKFSPKFAYNIDMESVMSDDKMKQFLQDDFLNIETCKILDVSNFLLNRDGSRLATQDFRIFIDSLEISIPKNEMYHCASIASMMLSGVINYAIGYDYIRKRLKKYGVAEFIYSENGFMKIRVINGKKDPFKPPSIIKLEDADFS